MMKKTNLLLVAMLSVLFMSCTKDNDTEQSISQEIKDLIHFTGDEQARIVVINVQAGPDIELSTTDTEQIALRLSDTNFLAVNVHQAQTLSLSLITEDDITLEQADAIKTETIEILYKVITYFKEQGRTVFVFGRSFGAFVTQELIARKGIDVADSYLIMLGRLDINDVIWQAFAEGGEGYFEDGINPVIVDEIPNNIIDRNLNRIIASYAKNRYTEIYSNIEDLSKILYVYAQTDEFVGSLTLAEDDFLISKNASVYSGNGGHDQTLNLLFRFGFEMAFGIK